LAVADDVRRHALEELEREAGGPADGDLRPITARLLFLEDNAVLVWKSGE
jgi:hypothetical protein